MKILWFTNTPCSATEILKPELNRGGWLSSLEKAITQTGNVELHIAFYYGVQLAPFKHNNTWFYPIFRKNKKSKISRFISRVVMHTNNDKLEINLLIKVITQILPDIIHVHGTEDNFGLIQYHTTIPVVISMQGIINPYSEKFYSGIPSSVASKYESNITKLTLTNFRYKYLDFKQMAERERKILCVAKNIIGRTDWDRQVTRILAPYSKYFVGEEMLRESFYKYKWQKNEFNNPIQIISIMGTGLYKGFETILRTAQLLKTCPDIKFKWLVVGLDKQSEIVKISTKWLHVTPDECDLHLLGELTEYEIVKLLISSDIYSQVSHIENSPNSLCEAMLLGMPIVASFAGGTCSLIENGKEGILVQDGDPYALAGCILELKADFRRASNISSAAKIRAGERHGKSKIISQMTNIYKAILDE